MKHLLEYSKYAIRTEPHPDSVLKKYSYVELCGLNMLIHSKDQCSQDEIEAIDIIVKNAPPLKKDMIFYRGLKSYELERLKNNTLEFDRFFSITSDIKIAENYATTTAVLKFKLPKGTPGVFNYYDFLIQFSVELYKIGEYDLQTLKDEILNAKDEHEYLMQPSTFKIIGEFNKNITRNGDRGQNMQTKEYNIKFLRAIKID